MIITAEDAKILVSKFKFKRDTERISKILDSIEEAAILGKTCIEWIFYLRDYDEMHRILTSRGFVIHHDKPISELKSMFGYDGAGIFKISWRE